MKTLILTAVSILILQSGNAQEMYYTKNATIDFFSSTPIEDIKAVNNDVVSFMKTNGIINFGVIIKSFKFENGLMQEHFNENYMESDKYPKAIFEGKIDNIESVNFKADGVYPLELSGKLTIHGITKNIETKAILLIKSGNMIANSFMKIKPEDYNIEIPALVRDNIAKIIDVNIKAEYRPYVKD